MMDTFEATHRRSRDGDNLGGSCRGNGFTFTWRGTESPNGVDPVTLLTASLDRLKQLQRTNVASTKNAKLIFDLSVALETYNDDSPSMGGELNNLIPQPPTEEEKE